MYVCENIKFSSDGGIDTFRNQLSSIHNDLRTAKKKLDVPIFCCCPLFQTKSTSSKCSIRFIMSQLICTYKHENVPFRKDKFPSRANAMQSNSVFIVVVRHTATERDIGRCTHIRFEANRIPSANQSFRTYYNIYLTVYDLRKAFSFCVKSSIIDEKSTRLKIRI